jgi:hypothetical protein
VGRRDTELLEAILQKLECIEEQGERSGRREERLIGLLEQIVKLQTPNRPPTVGGSISVKG